MRVALCALFVMLAAPAVAGPPAPGSQAERLAEQIRSRGPVAFINKPCGLLRGMPLWGGLNAMNPKKIAELKGPGMKLNCGPGNRVDVVVLTKGFKGRMPKKTSWDMKQKVVYKTLKKAGLKDRTVKGSDADGAFVRLKGEKPITWRWDDAKGKGAVAKIVIKKK